MLISLAVSGNSVLFPLLCCSVGKMELSSSVQTALQCVSDPGLFNPRSFASLLDASYRSLLSSHCDRSVLAQPELKHVDQILLKQCHTALTTFILEGVKQNADKSTISSCLEDVSFDPERTEIFYDSFQKHKGQLEALLTSIGRCPPHINDVSWRLQYHMKNGHMQKVNEPFYLLSLNVENAGMMGATEDINFSCSVEQLQDLVGKLKDAAKSLEKATQM